MNKADTITITLKGEKSKKYLLDKMSKELGIRFAKIPQEELVIEEQGDDSKISVELFKDFLSLNILDEVEFSAGSSPKIATEEVHLPVKKEVDKKQETAEVEIPPSSNTSQNAVTFTIEPEKAKAIAMQTPGTRKILKLFASPKYINILKEIFRHTTFNSGSIRKEFNYAYRPLLSDVIYVLDKKAIHYDNIKNDGTYSVDRSWRNYALIRLGTDDTKPRNLDEVASLLDKGLVYENPEGKYCIMDNVI